MKSLTIYQVDAFTDRPFSGNPAGVCILGQPMDDHLMQNIAREMNLSETAFLWPVEEDEGFHIRFFTPRAEVDLCGHASLSSAHILYELGLREAEGDIQLESKAGRLLVHKTEAGIELDFPAYERKKVEISTTLTEALGLKPKAVYQASYNWVMAVLEKEEQVANLQPDFSKLVSSGNGHIMVTAPADDAGTDFVVRCFAPDLGINEDPVTGSAHCALTPYWTGILNKEVMHSRQLSDRGGKLIVSQQEERVLITGEAVTVLKGEMYLQV